MGFKRGILILVLLAATRASAVELSTSTTDHSTSAASTFTWRTIHGATLPKEERLQFVIKWGVVVAGYSWLSIEGTQPINGRPAYHIVAKAKSAKMVRAFYKVEDLNQSWLDQDSLVSVRAERKIREGKYRIEETVDIDQPRQRYYLKAYRIDKDRHVQKEGDTPPNVLDVLGSLYYVRVLPLEVGKTYVFDVLSGDKVYPLEVKVKKREEIKVPAGKFDTFLVEPFLRGPGIFIAKGKKLEVWLTADDRRMPVRMRTEVFIGHVSAELLPE